MITPCLPEMLLSPSRDFVVTLTPRDPTPKELDVPAASAGPVTISRITLGPRYAPRVVVELLRLADGTRRPVHEGRARQVWPIGFSPDGKLFAFAYAGRHGVSACTVECSTGATVDIPGDVNASASVFGEAIGCWVGSSMLAVLLRCHGDVGGRFDAPEIADTARRGHEFACADDPALRRSRRVFTSQIGIACVRTGRVRRAGRPDLYRRACPSPDGRYLLVGRHVPVHHVITDVTKWPCVSEVWDLGCDADAPPILSTSVHSPGGGRVDYGRPGHWYWHPIEPATIVWLAEAQDRGCEIRALRAPFDGEPRTLHRLDAGCVRFCWTMSGRLLILQRDLHGTRSQLWLVSPPGADHVLLSEHLISRAAVPDVCEPWQMEIPHAEGEWRPIWMAHRGCDGVVEQHGGLLYLTGTRRSDDDCRLLLDAVDATSGARSTLYESPPGLYERLVGFGDAGCSTIVIAEEDRQSPPRYAVVGLQHSTRCARIHLNPAASPLTGVMRCSVAANLPYGFSQLLEVHLPADRLSVLPVLLWIQPRLNGAPPDDVPRSRYRGFNAPVSLDIVRSGLGFTEVSVLLRPFHIEAPHKMVEELAEQLAAVIDALVESGMADRGRVAVGGHCLGAYATAMLLARTQLFGAGVASGGRYNLASLPRGGALTAHRPLHEAPDVYIDRSPLTHAAGIRAPLLLVHGERDDFIPVAESDELFRAIDRAGGRCRFVRIANEGHIFRTQEGRALFESEVSKWCQQHLLPPVSALTLYQSRPAANKGRAIPASFHLREFSGATTVAS